MWEETEFTNFKVLYQALADPSGRAV